MRNIYILSLLFLSSFTVFGQQARLKYADKLFERQSYYAAASAYEDVLARRIDSSDIAPQIAESYDKSGSFDKALSWYRYLDRHQMLSKENLLRLALLERRFSHYDLSDKHLRSYKEKYGVCDVCDHILNSPQSLESLNKSQDVFVLEVQKINTDRSEIVGSYLSDHELLISSSKRSSFAVNRVHNWTGGYYYELYKSEIDAKGQLGKMKRVKGKVHSKFNDGPVVYHPATGYLYFTRNTFYKGKKGKDADKRVHLSIYRAKFNGKKFKEVSPLNINSNAYSTAHPALSKDGKRLYFSSDRPGGYGGMDLYMVNLDEQGNAGTEQPVNLGAKVNTSAHEVFPFYQDEEELLLFSSEGHFGLGGLDVYLAYLDKNGGVRKITNVGAPVNSPSDDFSFINNEKQTHGYFSSNRPLAKGEDDVFGFTQTKPFENEIMVHGDVRNLITNVDLEKTTVYLKTPTGVILDSAITNNHGMFEMSLRKDTRDFVLTANKEGFIPLTYPVDYEAETQEYDTHLLMMPVLEYRVVGTIVEKGTNAPLENVLVAVIDRKKGNAIVENLTTDTDGRFRSSPLDYAYADTVHYAVKLTKTGFVSRFATRQEVLALEEKIDLSANMTRIEIGKTDLNEIVAINPIYFDFNSSVIRSDAKVELDKIVEVMKENPGMVIELGSHTDSRGQASYNLWLSDRRAKSSAQYIISQGIPKDRIYGKGYGKTKLLATDAEISRATSEEEKEALHQKNRRTEFIIVKMK